MKRVFFVALAVLASNARSESQQVVHAPHEPATEAAWWLELEPCDGAGAVLVRQDGARARLVSEPMPRSDPCRSPDGRRIVAVVRRGRERDLVVRTLSTAAGGEGEVRLTEDHDDLDPVWSRDGETVWFRSDRDGDGWQLFAIPAGGGAAPRRISERGAEVREFALSPAGTRVLLERWKKLPAGQPYRKGAPNRDIAIVDLETGTTRVLIDGLSFTDAAWSPNGSKVAAAADTRIVVLDAGSGEVLRTWDISATFARAYAHGASAFVWRPDSQAFACRVTFLGGRMVVDGEESRIFGDREVFVFGVESAATVLEVPKDERLAAAWSGRPAAWRRLPR